MFLTFLGAARQVTGSNYLFETAHTRFLVDCGMFQGSDFNAGRNHDALAYDPKRIDGLIVTHAHLDHSGRVPYIVHNGYRKPVYGTKGTLRLAKLIWEDALNVMSYDYRKFGVPMLFHTDDLVPAGMLCTEVNYHEWVNLAPDVRFKLFDAGHIFGSSFVLIEAEGKRVLVSGDVGNTDMPIIKETEPLPEDIDVMLVDSTYGDRVHEAPDERRRMIQKYITEAVERGGTILIPAFSIERTQELLYYLYDMMERKKIIPRIPIFLDSPLAIKAIDVYRELPEYYDKDAAALAASKGDFFRFPGLSMTLTRDESKMINNINGPKMIIAGAGMMNGGRIVHHLFRHISDPKTTVFIVGYQAEGTLGRRLYEGASEVTILGERKEVRANIVAMGALSAHADQKKLIDWIAACKNPPKRIFPVHGEPHASTELAHRLRDRLSNIMTEVPEEKMKITL